jgi:hypothetical protein
MRNAGYLALFLAFFTFCSPHRGFKSALANDEQIASDNPGIDSREQELRRKEQELLKAMDLNSSEASQTPETLIQKSPPFITESSEGEITGTAKVLEIKAPEAALNGDTAVSIDAANPVSHENIKLQQPAERVTTASEAPKNNEGLKGLEHHPALEPPQKPKVVPVVTSTRIRTKRSEDFPDGTTARRIGSFHRIDRSGSSAHDSTNSGHTRNVPLTDLGPATAVRPALLTSDELATIRNSSTYLKTGPTRLDSTLLRIPQNSEVSIDYRSGAWYRIRTTNGVRGWVPGSSLLFDAGVNPRSTVRVGGIQGSLR